MKRNDENSLFMGFLSEIFLLHFTKRLLPMICLIIENDGSQNYRISTHPDFVTYDKKKLSGQIKGDTLMLPSDSSSLLLFFVVA